MAKYNCIGLFIDGEWVKIFDTLEEAKKEREYYRKRFKGAIWLKRGYKPTIERGGCWNVLPIFDNSNESLIYDENGIML